MSSVGIAAACALIIIAHTPAVLTDMMNTAVAQIRVNAAKTPPPVVTLQEPIVVELSEGENTSVSKKAK